jgi:hypothetical protein
MVRAYREWNPGRLGELMVLDQLYYEQFQVRVRDAAVRAIQAEAPIHPERLAKVVAGAFGLTKVNENRRRSILTLVPRQFRRDGGEGFFWPADVDAEKWRIVRRPADGVSRPLDQVCLIEIGNAMIVVAQQTGGIEEDDLKREALNLLGSRRVTQGVGARLDDALTTALKRGVLRENGSGVITVPE